MSVDEYIEKCSELSLTARLAIALLIFKRYCKARNLESHMTTEFSEYLWKWPLIEGPDEFVPWEFSRPELVNIGLGDPMNDEIKGPLLLHHIDESDFREIVSGIVEILWGSFWGAADDKLSLKALKNVVLHSELPEFPPITPFKFSRFQDGNGWGSRITPDDLEFWKKCE